MNSNYAGLVIRVWNQGSQVYFHIDVFKAYAEGVFPPVILYTASNNEYCEIDWLP